MISSNRENKDNKIRTEKDIQNIQIQLPDKKRQSSEDKEDKKENLQDNKPKALPESTDNGQQNNLLHEPSNISDLKESTVKAPEISKPLQTSPTISNSISNPIASTSEMTINSIESKPSQEIGASFKINENNIQEIKLKAVATLLSTLSGEEKSNLDLEESYDDDVCFIIKQDANNEVFIGISIDDTECNRNYDDIGTVPLLKIEKSEIDNFKQAMLNGKAFDAKRYFNASQGKFESHNENITLRYQDAYGSDNAEEKATYIFLDFPNKNKDYST